MDIYAKEAAPEISYNFDESQAQMKNMAAPYIVTSNVCVHWEFTDGTILQIHFYSNFFCEINLFHKMLLLT